jgi:maltose O-acetyltransferase
MVGDNLWLGGGVVVCPGVGIGENTVVGAGAVGPGTCPPTWSPLAARVIRSL